MIIFTAFYLACILASLVLFIVSLYTPWMVTRVEGGALVPAGVDPAQFDFDLLELAKGGQSEIVTIKTLLIIGAAASGVALLLILMRLRIMLVIQLLLLISTVCGLVSFGRFTRMTPVEIKQEIESLDYKASATFRNKGYIMAAAAGFFSLVAFILSVIITNLSLIVLVLIIIGVVISSVLISQQKPLPFDPIINVSSDN